MIKPFAQTAAVTSVAIVVAIVTPGMRSTLAQDGRDDVERGKQLYYDHACYSCHGYNGETGVRDLVGTGSPIIADADTFVTYLRQRGDALPVFPSTSMPSYSEATLSGADARDIFAYIQTFELDAPDVEEIPALRAIVESVSER